MNDRLLLSELTRLSGYLLNSNSEDFKLLKKEYIVLTNSQ